MRRASRDYTKYLRGSEEMGSGGSGAPHEGPLHAPQPPAPPAPHQPAAASRSMFVALLGLGLGQVICSIALFLYFRAQVSARLPGGARAGRTHQVPPALRLAAGSAAEILQIWERKVTLKTERPAGNSQARGTPASGLCALIRPRSARRLGWRVLVSLNFPRRDSIGRSPLLEMIAHYPPPPQPHFSLEAKHQLMSI